MEEKKRAIMLEPGRMSLSEYARQDWVVNVQPEATVEDIEVPHFWSLMASQMRPYDRVEVRAEDGSWIADALVLCCDRTWAKVKVLAVHQLTTGDVALTQSAKYEVFWRGPQHKWSVKDTATSEPIKSGCSSKEEATLWMKEHERVVA